MYISIKNPDIFNITYPLENKIYYGGNQDWYEKRWHKDSGCGPTTAANITAYLALTRENCVPLYEAKSMEWKPFREHMDEMFRYITPGPMGVNNLSKFIKGFLNYTEEKGVTLKPISISVDRCNYRKRDVKALENFVKDAIESDCPIAFLNLSRGKETRLQGWHWITITSVRIENDDIIATASDEGDKIEFSLKLWYLTTMKHGGLIYFK